MCTLIDTQAERAEKYPSRFIVPDSIDRLVGYTSPDTEVMDQKSHWVVNLRWVAKSHYHAVECKEDGTVRLGDVVAMDAGGGTEVSLTCVSLHPLTFQLATVLHARG